MAKGGVHGEGVWVAKGVCMAKRGHAWQREWQGSIRSEGGHVW